MPYIEKIDRGFLDDKIDENITLENPGELNYMITKICNEYLNAHGEKYATYNSIIGALECCKLELYRRLIVPYEDQKIIENGDVYEILHRNRIPKDPGFDSAENGSSS